MSETARATQSQKEITLAGQTFFARPMTYEEIGEFELAAIAWFYKRLQSVIAILPPDAQEQRIATAEMVADRMSVSVRKRFKDATKDTPGAIGSDEIGWKIVDQDHHDTLAAEAMERFLGTLEGATRYLWLSIRRQHPTLTLSAVGILLMDEARQKAVTAQLNAINSLSAGQKAAADQTTDAAEKKD